jgi:tetratricopeptide (TPR) repeat protein
MEWLERLEIEHDNLRAALGEAVRQGDATLALRICGALWWGFWTVQGHSAEGRDWLERSLALPGPAPAPIRATALRALGLLAHNQGDAEHAGPALEEGLELFRVIGDQRGTAQTLNLLGILAHDRGDSERAAALLEEGLALSRSLGATAEFALAVHRLGLVAHDRGDLGRAVELYEETLALSRGLGNQMGVAWALHTLGRAIAEQGDSARAAAILDESLALFRALGAQPGVAATASRLGQVVGDRGEHGRAIALFAEGIGLAQTHGPVWGVAQALEGAAGVMAASQPAQAARLLGAADLLREAAGVPPVPADSTRLEITLAVAKRRLGEEEFSAEWQKGRALPIDDVIAQLLALATEPDAAFGEQPPLTAG